MFRLSFPIETATDQILEIDGISFGVGATSVPAPYAFYYDQPTGCWIDDTNNYPSVPNTIQLKYVDSNTQNEVVVDSVSYLIGTRPQRPR